MSCLSSTAMTKHLSDLKFQVFCDEVQTHFEANSSDSVSAIKVVKALAWYFYGNSVDVKNREDVIDCAILAANIIKEKDNSEKVIKDAVSSLNFLIDRLLTVDKDIHLLAKLAPIVLSMLNCSPVKLTSLSQTLYVTLWNFSIGIVSSIQTEEDLISLLTIRDVALNCQLHDITVKTFTFTKFLQKLQTSSKSVDMKPEAERPKSIMMQNLVKILNSSEFKKSEDAQYFELWNFSVEFCFKQNIFSSHLDELMNIEKISDLNFDVILFIRDIFVSDNKTSSKLLIEKLEVADDGILNLALKILLEKSDVLEHMSRMKKENCNQYDVVVEGLIKLCCQSRSKTSSTYACQILNIIEKIEIDNGDIEDRLETIRKLIECHENLMKWMENNCKDNLSVLLNKFTLVTTKIGFSLTTSKDIKSSIILLRQSCSWSEKLLELDPTFSHYVLFTRYRSLADVEHHEGELWESLVHTAKAVIYLLTSQHQQTNEKLVDMSRDWNIRRIKWMNQTDEKDQLLPDSEVKKTEATVLDMLSIDLANVAKTCVTRLLIWEVSSYRQRYDEGADLHEVVIRCLEQILQTDKTEVNVAMVLIEQAWIFWYQADTDQLESAAKCCDKAAKSLNKLNEKLYLGVAYFLRFLVEQRLLQIQIQKEVEEEEKRVILDGRKEKEGIDKGCEILEENGRPIFTGLSLDTENKLSEYLVNSAQAFNQYQHQDLGAWYPVKDILDIQLGVADSLHIFNKPSTRLLENMLKVAEEHTQTDYTILGFIRLYRKNPTHYQQNITKLCELSKRVSSVGLLYQISLTVARNFLHLQKYDECEEILDTILSNPFTQKHSDKSMIICAEGYHIASLLRYQNRKPLKLDPDVNLESSYSPVASLGTLELELEAFKLIQACSFYYEEDRKLPGRQSPRILWLGPSITQLTLEIAEHLIKLQNHIGAPRELRSYIKWGLKFSQTNCFPLHTCVFLIESAKSHLLCDDEHQAFVQLNGVQDVLGTILKQRSKDKVVSSDVENRAESLPGGHQHLRSASPALFRNELVVPQFLDDEKDCDCHNCANILLSKVYAKFANTWARALMMSGEARAGHLAFKTSKSLLDKVRDKLKVGSKVLDLDPEIEEVSFHNIKLENLVHESESLAFSGDLEGALKIADSIQLPGVKASKNDIVIDWRLPEINPTLVFCVIELKSSLKLVNQKTVVDDLTVSLDNLCVNKLLTDYQGQCTPIADKPNKTMTKAPMKKMYPSLGIGDADHLAKDDSLCLGGDQLDIAFLDSEFTVAQSDLVTQSSTEGTFHHTNQHNQHHFQHHINSHNQVEYELSNSPPPPVIVHPDFNRTRSLDLPQYCVSCEREAHGNCVGTSVDEDDIQGDPLVYATFVAPIQQYSTETDSSRQQSFNSQPSINSRQPSFNSRQQSFNSQRQPGSNLSSRQPSFGSRQQSFNSRQPSCVNSRQPSCNSLHGSRQHSSRQPSFSKQNSLEVETFCEGRGLNKKSSSSCLSVPGYNSSPHFSHNSRESSSEPVIVTIPYKDTVSKSEEFLNTENKSDQLFAEKKNSGIPCQNTNVAEAGSQDLNGKDISHNHTGDLNNKTTPVPNSIEAGMETLERIGGGGSSSQNARGKCRRLQECNNTNKTNCNRWEGNEAVNCDGGHVNNSRWSPTADNWLATDTTDDLDSEATQELQELNHQLNEERLSFIHSQSSSKEDDYKEFKEEEYNVPTPPPPPPPMHQVPIMPPIPPTPVTGAGGNIGGKPRESTPMIHGPSSIGFRQESSQGGWGSGEESPTPPPEPIEPSQQSHTSTIRRKSKRDRNKTTIVTSERTNNCNSSCHNSTTQAATNSSERLNNVCNKKNSNKARSKSRSPGRSRGSGGGMDRAIVIVHHTTCTHHSGSSRSRDMSPEDNVSEESSLSLYQEHDDGITSPCDVESGNSADMVPPMPPVRTSSMDHLVHHAGDHLVHHTGDHLVHHTGDHLVHHTSDHLVHHTGGLDHGGLDYGELDHTTAPPPGWDSCQTNIKNSRVHPSAPPMHPQYQGDVEHYHRTSAGSTPGGRGSTPGGRGSTPGGRNLQYSNWESCRESWFSSGSDCAPRPSSGSDCPPQPTYMANTRTVDTENPTTVHPKQVSTGSGSDSHILSSSYRCHSPPPPPPSSQQYYGTLVGRGSSGTTNYQFSSTLPKMAHNHKMKTSIPNLRQVSREVPNLRQSSRESGSSSSRPSSRDRPLPPTRSQIRTISPKHERRAVSSINLSKPQDQQSRDSTPSESIGSSLQSGPSLPRLDFDQTLGVSNLVDLEPLTEDAALTNLNIRFKNDQIYTWSSSVLLSINCYKKLSLYTPEVIDAYRSQPSCQLPPHIYSLADRGWHALRDRGEDQAVILTGESGSGKTEAGKLVLQYIAAVTHHSSEFHDIKYQLLQSNPVLEAFGNAKTLHNDNSSRFGKYLEVSFDFKGDPTGGYINHYLLEKTRVTGFQPGDRNFHIFYQIIAGADIHLLKDLKLQRSLENYQLLRSGSEAASQGMRSEAGQSQSQKGGSVADRRDFIITKTALEDLGVDSGERLDLLKLVAVVLKLGNLTFLPTTNMDGTEGCTIANDYELYESCDLLLGDPLELKSALISRTVAINSDIIVSELSALEAADGRDRLCRTLYTRLFTWLVNRINQAIKVKTHKKHNVLGILDIYGFEAFETNSFEQFIINFANEKIQQVFVDWTFRKEQQEIVGEGLQWSQIGYFSNSVICSLIEQPGRGILPILDNLSNKLGDCAVTGNIADFQTGDLDLLQGLDETFSNHPHYEASSTFAHTVASGGSEPSNGGEPGGEAAASDQEQDSGVPAPAEAFRIKHYAGSVTYSVSGFLSKNCDYLDPSISRILYASEHNLLKTLFPEGNLKRCVRRKPVTLGTQFKISLGALFTNLYSKTPHFIRCIKPNESKTPRLFDTSLVQHQFRYLGVMELTRLRSAGFVYHETYDRFLARYKLLCPHTWPSWRGSPVDGVTYIFREVPLAGSDYAFGNTKIFIRRVETMEKLEEWRLERIQDLATMIQKIWRGYKARKNWSQLRESQIVISGCWKRWKDKSNIIDVKTRQENDRAARVIQRAFRTCQRRRWLIYLAHALPSESPISRDWPRPPPSLIQASNVLRRLYHRWRCERFRERFDQTARNRMREKVTASLIFKDKKSSYPKSIGHPFLGDYVRLRQNPQWKKICSETNDQYVVFADIINKITRTGGKFVPILFVISTSSMLILDQRTMQIKYRVPAGELVKLSLSPFLDDIAVFHVRASSPTHEMRSQANIPNCLSSEAVKRKGDFVFQTGHVIEIVTKLFLVVQNCTGKPPAVNISTQFNANFGTHSVTLQFKSIGDGSTPGSQMKILKKGNKMEVVL